MASPEAIWPQFVDEGNYNEAASFASNPSQAPATQPETTNPFMEVVEPGCEGQYDQL